MAHSVIFAGLDVHAAPGKAATPAVSTFRENRFGPSPAVSLAA
jgi:hypothetical protein